LSNFLRKKKREVQNYKAEVASNLNGLKTQKGVRLCLVSNFLEGGLSGRLSSKNQTVERVFYRVGQFFK